MPRAKPSEPTMPELNHLGGEEQKGEGEKPGKEICLGEEGVERW